MIEKFKPAYTSIALHPGGSSLAVDESGDLVLLGGADGSAGVHSISQNKVVHTLEGAKGQVTDTLWWGSRAVISTASGQVLVFEEGRQTVAFTSHAGRVAALALHPTGEILASVGADKSFVFYDLTTHRQISQMFDESGELLLPCFRFANSQSTKMLTLALNPGLTTAAFHPDGHLFAAGTSTGQIQFYNVLSGAHSGSIDVAGPVQSFSFSENGIWLAVACAGQTSVAIWNLRTMALLKELEMGSPVDSVRWDYIGQFLAAAGPSGVTVRWYSKESKEWSEPLQSAVPSVALEWGPQAHSLVCLGGGGTITVLRETK
jgi:pre-mRNA-processing factor 19